MDNLTGLASMVAYNLMLAIFPLALLALFVAGRILRSPDVADSVIQDARKRDRVRKEIVKRIHEETDVHADDILFPDLTVQ